MQYDSRNTSPRTISKSRFIFCFFEIFGSIYDHLENIFLLRQVLGDVAGVAYFTGHEQTQLNIVF